MAKSKSKKTTDKVDVAIAATAKSDRYAPRFAVWADFVKATFPEDKYPTSREVYLK